MSRPVQRAFSFLRSASRANQGVRSSCAAFSRRTMASSAPHASHGSQGSDTVWMIGSALVFGPAFLYLLSPSARKTGDSHASEHSHGAHRSDASHHAEPQPAVKDDEGAEVSGDEIKDSMDKAFDADSPKDAQEHEEVVAKGEETSAESSEAVPQESADSATSETESAPSEEKSEPEVTQPESPATTDAGEATQEAAEEKH
ncbi:hypothetical protein AZE42_03819 [Rhizopogon vesiculosus]|uniref:Uncharacterized protein n=1 Tax=Rhizopogon vesiculosus TaxID=180088 RepID=A0A1J8QE07_9AGAM|nr:hypothetical protein AZE42_03819 [Rhizopogon vesiculosus]